MFRPGSRFCAACTPVVVNGTRIISEAVLTASDAVFINMHAGITPKYRGVHGGYWALYNGDGEAASSTRRASIPARGIISAPICFSWLREFHFWFAQLRMHWP